MEENMEKRWLALTLAAFLLSLAACTPDGGSTEAASQPTATTAAPASGEGRCGDGVCEGPENAQICPEDCAGGLPAGASDACLNPNPHHAVISTELTAWRDWLEDGGFETGTAEAAARDVAGLARGTAERSQAAARSGAWGYALTAGPGEGVSFSIRAYLDKGEDVRFSFWVRSPGGEAEVRPAVHWTELHPGPQPLPPHVPDGSFTAGPEWSQVSFIVGNSLSLRHALLTVDVGPDTLLHLDDVAVEGPVFRVAEYAGDSRVVGGIPVPAEPVAPLYFTVLIHIENPSQLQTQEDYFQHKTAVFTELARTLHAHGGRLTIQSEEGWPMGSELYDPGLLARLADEYGVVYSTHTHGPACRDADGRLRSQSDCSANRDAPGWDHEIDTAGYPEVVEYVRNQRDLTSAAAGQPVTDHNGNWDFGRASAFAEIPMLTWSAYKNPQDQRTYDVLINNPWRPAEGNAIRQVERFLTHDPRTGIVYVPGWGQALTRHEERLLDKARPLVSQFIRYASADRVNTCYILTHADLFYAQDQADEGAYLVYDEQTGRVVYSDEFRREIAYWDEMLTQLIDPLVAEGYVAWSTLPEMGEMYREWEEDCAD
jgi:hypothetical protein